MATVYQDSKTAGAWWAAYRPGRWEGRKRGRKYLGRRDREVAEELANDLERCSQQLDAARPSRGTCYRAEELGLITEEQRKSILGEYRNANAMDPNPTVEALYDAHPSTVREEEQDQHAAVNYGKYLQAFLEWADITNQSQVTLDLVQKYVSHLRKLKCPWDTRRHRLLPIRRACAMGARLHGLADPLYKMRIDPKMDGDVSDIEYFTLDELKTALAWGGSYQETIGWRKKDRSGKIVTGNKVVTKEFPVGPREWTVIALGAFHGMRPSELIRIRCGDLRDGVLQIGLRERKTRASRRDIPLAPTARTWCEELADGRKSNDYLLLSDGNWETGDDGKKRRVPGPFRACSFGPWVTGWMAKATGRTLPAKAMRKSFGNIMVQIGIDERYIEAYYGHKSRRFEAVTNDHYVHAARTRELIKAGVPARIEELLT